MQYLLNNDNSIMSRVVCHCLHYILANSFQFILINIEKAWEESGEGECCGLQFTERTLGAIKVQLERTVMSEEKTVLFFKSYSLNLHHN